MPGKIELNMKVFVLGAKGGTGPLIVRFRRGKKTT